jgi:signal recognition particle subunit SRP54
MFDQLSTKIEGALHKLRGKGKINELNIAESMKEIRKALLDADVNYKIAKDFTNTVKEKAMGQQVLQSLQPGQLMVKIVRDELASLMGSNASELQIGSKLSVVLMAGLQGSGKTTFSGKLANYLKTKKSKKPLLVACDVYRPAAIDQLHIVGEQLGVEVYSDREQKDPVVIANAGLEKAKTEGYNVVIIDTAGRLALDEAMMKEIKAIHTAIRPDETLFVVDAMTGQDAVNTAKAFNDVLDFDGVVLTKLDGDTRGGAALTIREVVDKPIKFIGTGEKLDALDIFHPDRMADRILGMGDVVSLVERAQEQFDEEEARKLQRKIAKQTFGFDDFLTQIQQIKKMGPMKDLVSMVPGMAKAAKGLDIDDNAFKHIEAIIHSMTPKERSNPKLLDQSRKKRIAAGSGREIQEVNKLIKQFDQMSKMMKMMQGAKGRNMMQMMQNMNMR